MVRRPFEGGQFDVDRADGPGAGPPGGGEDPGFRLEDGFRGEQLTLDHPEHRFPIGSRQLGRGWNGFGGAVVADRDAVPDGGASDLASEVGHDGRVHSGGADLAEGFGGDVGLSPQRPALPDRADGGGGEFVDQGWGHRPVFRCRVG